MLSHRVYARPFALARVPALLWCGRPAPQGPAFDIEEPLGTTLAGLRRLMPSAPVPGWADAHRWFLRGISAPWPCSWPRARPWPPGW
jgi:hypothetical protein